MSLSPRAVVVHRRTELDALVAHHGTRQQAEFFLRSRGRDPAAAGRGRRDPAGGPAPRRGDDPGRLAPGAGRAHRPVALRLRSRGHRHRGRSGRTRGQRGEVPRRPAGDRSQPRSRAQPGRPGPHPPAALAGLLARAVSPDVHVHIEPRTMVIARVDDGQELRGLNEIYLGHPSHQSARYRLATADGATERQSSSGVLVGTGTGATGWCRSVGPGARVAAAPARAGRARPVLVHPRGLAVAGHRHGTHRGTGRRERRAHRDGRVRPGRLRATASRATPSASPGARRSRSRWPRAACSCSAEQSVSRRRLRLRRTSSSAPAPRRLLSEMCMWSR